MTELELLAKWEAKASEYEQLGVSACGASLCRAFLADFAEVKRGSSEQVLTLAQAATYSGYSEAHLRRLVGEGKVKSLRPARSRGRITFRASDLPRKPAARHDSVAGVHELASRLGIRGRGGRYGQS